MQNLIHPKKRILMSSIGLTTLGVYPDKNSIKKLVFKKEGIEVPAVSETVSYQSSHQFVKKNVYLELLSGTLTEAKDIGIRVVSKLKYPAYVDNSEYRPTGKFYGANFAIGKTELEIELEIMNQIAKDLGIADTKNGAVVNAYRAYVITDDQRADDSTITVTLPTGAVTVTGSAHAADQLCTAFNIDANVNTVLKAYPIAEDTILVVSVNPNYNYTIAAGTDTTVVSRGLFLESRLEDVLFDVEIDTDLWDKSSYAIAEITSSDAFAAATNLHVLYNATVNEVTAGTNIATVRTAINGLTSVRASTYGTTKILIASEDATKAFDITKPYINKAKNAPFTSNVTINQLSTPTGAFSQLTADDVQRVFATADHAGDLSTAIRKTQTVADTEYVRVAISGVSPIGALEGANHLSSYKTEVEFYVPKDLLRADLFIDSSWMADSGTPDSTLTELLAYWQA